jgi:hypothetical protein
LTDAVLRRHSCLARSASTWGRASSLPKRLQSRTNGRRQSALAQSEDAVKVEVLNDIQPLPGTAGYGTVASSLRTPFMDEWSTKREEARREGGRLWAEIQASVRDGGRHETLVTAGQTSGGIKEILAMAEIIRQLAAEAETALSRGSTFGSR